MRFFLGKKGVMRFRLQCDCYPWFEEAPFPMIFDYYFISVQRPGAVFFKAGCNEQMFHSKPWKKERKKKKNGAESCCRFREKCKLSPKIFCPLDHLCPPPGTWI